MNEVDVTLVWNSSEDQLFELLGAELLGGGLGVGADDPEHASRFARKWFLSRRNKLREKLCGKTIVESMTTESGARMVEITTIMELMGQEFGSDQVHLLLAVLLLRQGLTTLCGDAQ
jgi:hypothetical protein